MNSSSYNSYHYRQYTLGALTLDNINFPDFQNFWFGFPLKAGFVFKNHFEIYGGYQFVTAITDNYNGLSGNYSQYQFGINYLFDIK